MQKTLGDLLYAKLGYDRGDSYKVMQLRDEIRDLQSQVNHYRTLADTWKASANTWRNLFLRTKVREEENAVSARKV